MVVTKDDTVGYYHKALLFYLNTGNGTFSEPRFQSIGVAASELLMGDLNNDGWQDILSTDHNNNSVTVLLNAKTSSGTFLAPAHYSTGGGTQPPKSVLSDINGDGYLDVLTQLSGGVYPSGVLVFLNKGDGSLSSPTKIEVNTSNFLLTDLTNDNKPELVILSSVNLPSLRVLINQGGGTFSAPTSYTIARDVSSAASLDMNVDGFPDLIVSTPSFIALLLNKGDGTLYPYQTLTSDSLVSNLSVKDFNGDGYLDLVAIKIVDQDSYKYEFWVYLNTGNGYFAQPTRYPIGTFSLTIDIQDFDGDGRLDLAALSTSGYWIWYNCTSIIGYEYTSVKDGLWTDPSVWARNRAPGPLDRIRLRHAVTLPSNYTSQSTRVSFDAGGQLRYNPDSQLNLIK
ncbi:hypothetical protein GO730_38760 [Spirosoma sp. HMF3257]|uniref:VCBS repeat-containing protein n=1 Tax=Spirosoma telluris TaxID=2183553 RepID=A0A327NFK3_9BACT|nr:hypothetical protein [Spirosoma telluris]RAI72844.1 hypothetical protein HMF3257_38685 [Spirosoma telluris]